MKRFFTVVFFLLFTLLFTLVLLMGELKFYVLTPAFVKDTLRETKTYEKLVENVDVYAQQMRDQLRDKAVAGGQPPEAAQKLTEVVLQSVDDKWMEAQVEKSVDAAFAYLQSDEPAIKVAFDLRPFKRRLRENLGTYLAAEYNKLPEVPPEQFDQGLAQNPGAFPKNRPAGATLEQTLAKIGQNPVEMIMKNIPDTYTFKAVDNPKLGDKNQLAGLRQVKPYLKRFNLVFWILLATTLLLLLLFAKLTSKTWLEFLMRLGIYLSAALVPLLLFAVGWYVTTNIVLVELLARAEVPSVMLHELIEPLAAFVTNRTFLHLTLWSGGIAFLGLALAIPTGIVLRKRGISTLAALE